MAGFAMYGEFLQTNTMDLGKSVAARVMPFMATLALVLCGVAAAFALTPSGTLLSTSSSATYSNGSGASMPPVSSNTVSVTVSQTAAVSLTPTSKSVSVTADTTGYSAVTLKNTGNGSDTFTLSITGATAWNPKAVYDTNGDGVRQSTETTTVATTPAVAAGASYKFFVAATPPSGTPDGQSSAFALTARCGCDQTKQAQGSYTFTVGAPPPSACIKTWLLNGYYANADQATRLSNDYLGGESSAAPSDGIAQGGKVWSKRSISTDYIDFLGVYGSTSKNCAGYAFAYINSPTARSAQLWMGSDDGLKVWVNGQNVWTSEPNRSFTADQDKATVQLVAGWNRLLAKVSQGTGNWKLQVKVCDASGQLLSGVTWQADPPPAPGDKTPPTISGVIVTDITSTSASVTWSSNEPTTGSLRYGLTASLGSSVPVSALGTQHSTTLAGLKAATTYYYSIQATDAAGNSATTSVSTFATLAESSAGAYIRNWLVNGYFSNSDPATRLTTDYLGGEEYAAPTPGSSQAGKTWVARQSSTDAYDFAALFGASALNCAAYACAYVYSPSARGAQLWMGSDDGLKVWLNGANVWTNDVNRACVADQDKASVQLVEGWNRLLIKVSQSTTSWKLQAKVCDASGNAIPGVTTAVDTNDSDAPVITYAQDTAASGTRLVITWTTDEPATTEVDYGISSLSYSVSSPVLATSHAIAVTGLTPNTRYLYKVRSADQSGNASERAGLSATTTSALAAPFIWDWLTNGFYSVPTASAQMSTDRLGGESQVMPKPSAGWVQRTARFNGYLDLASAFGNPMNGFGYAHVYIYSLAEQPAELRIGSDDGVKAYLNGEVIWINDVYRTWVVDQDRIPIRVKEGWNRLLIKATQGTSSWGFSARVCDSAGQFIPGTQCEMAGP